MSPVPEIRPLHDLVLVRVDPLPEMRGSIVLVGDKGTEVVRTGTVLRAGPGKRQGKHRIPLGVEVGEQVAFFRWHQEHHSGKALSNMLGEDFALLHVTDVLFAFPADLKVDFNG